MHFFSIPSTVVLLDAFPRRPEVKRGVVMVVVMFAREIEFAVAREIEFALAGYGGKVVT